MFKELFLESKESKALDHSYEPALDNEYDQWNNPGQVIKILQIKPLSTSKTRDIASARYTGKIDLDMMHKLGYISKDGDMWSATQFGKDVLSYLSGFSKTKPKGYKGK